MGSFTYIAEGGVIHTHCRDISEGGVTHIHCRGWGHSHTLQRVGSFTLIAKGGAGFFLEYNFRRGKSTFLEIEGGTNYIN